MRVAFVPREAPLAPVAAVASGSAAKRLGERLLAMDELHLAELRGMAGPDLLFVLGDTQALPWVDGIAYLGNDPAAPRLLLPTALRPDVPASLFERALLAKVPRLSGPLAVLSSPRRLVDVGPARRVSRALLEAWVSRCP